MSKVKEKLMSIRDSIDMKCITVSRAIKTQTGEFSITFDTEIDTEKNPLNLEEAAIASLMISLETEKAVLAYAVNSGELSQEEGRDRFMALKNSHTKSIQEELKSLFRSE